MTMAEAESDYDLVVVGAGGTGLTAAVRAHDLGLRVVVAEALDRFGGGTAFSGGQVWVGANHVMRARGLRDSLDEVRAYILAIGDGRDFVDVPVFEQWTQEAPRVAEELGRAGVVEWDVVPDFPDYYYPGAEGSKEVGRYLTSAPFRGEVKDFPDGRIVASGGVRK